MEDKFVAEALAILNLTDNNPLIKNQKGLKKLKFDIMKALMEAGRLPKVS